MPNSPFGAYRGSGAPAIVAAQWQNARAGELFGRGLAGAGDAIGRAMERRKQDAQETKALRSMLDLYDPGNKDLRATKGLGELRGERDALAMALVKKREQQESELHTAQMDALKREQAAQQSLQDAIGQAGLMAGREDLAGLGQRMQQGGLRGGLAGLMQLGTPSGRTPMTGDMLVRAIAANPQAINTPLGQQLLLQQVRQEQVGPAKMPSLTNLGGRNVVYSPDTGAFQVLPPPLEASEATVRRDANGNVLGYSIGNQFIPDKSRAQAIAALQKQIDNEVKIYQTLGSKSKERTAQREMIDELQRQLNELIQGGSAPAAGGNDQDPLNLFN